MLRILLIEPNPQDAELIQEHFPAHWFHINSLSQAREHLQFTTFDLIISAYTMQASTVLALLPIRPPLIILSHEDDAEEIIKAFRSGVDDYIIKKGDYPSRIKKQALALVNKARQRDITDNLSFDNNVVGRLTISPDLSPLGCNATAARALGYNSVKEAMSQPNWRIHFNEEAIHFLHNQLTVQTVVQKQSDLLRTISGRYISVISNIGLHDDDTIEMVFVDASHNHSIEELVAINEDLEERVRERTRALEESKNRVQLILDNIRDAIIMTDAQGRIQQVNGRFVTLFQTDRDTHYNQHISTLFVEADRPTIHALLAQNKPGVSRELQAMTRHNSQFYAEVSMAIIPHHGKSDGYLFSIHNVDNQKRAERLLRQSEADLRAIFDSASIGLILFDRSMSIRTANSVAAQLINNIWSVNSLDKQLENSMDNDFLDAFTRSFEQALQGMTVNDEITLIDQQGKQLHLALNYTPVIDHSACVTGVCVMTENITARKQAESALLKSEERYRFVTELISDYAYSVIKQEDGTLDMEWITVSSFERVSGYTLDSQTTAGKVLALVAHDDDRQRAHDDLMRTFEGEPVSGTYRLVKHDGSIRWIYITRKPVWDEQAQAYTRTVGAVRDITEQLEMEHALRDALRKEKELNEMKSRFVSMVSHEFRTPLATIQAATELLKNHSDRMTPEQRERRYKKINQQIEHMTLMLEDVLTIGRFEAGTIDYQPHDIELTSFVLDTVNDVAEAYRSHHIDVSGFDVPVFIKGDPKLLRQTVSNLLSNAHKYSEKGTTIHVALTMTEKSDIALSVRDEGIGIPPADLPHMFEAFQRAQNVGTIQGNGLGLSIIKQAIDMHSGTITVDSTLGEGSVFTVTLPTLMQETPLQ